MASRIANLSCVLFFLTLLLGLFMVIKITTPDMPYFLPVKAWRDKLQSRPARPVTTPRPEALPQSRLQLTLAGNEERYQESIVNRYKLMEELGGPDALAFPGPESGLYTLWDLYPPIYSCPFPVYRVGTLGDGGKWVCGFERALSKPDCVVYSMGVEASSSFEEKVLTDFPKCEVYGFDYSVTQWGPQLVDKPELLSRAHFFPYLIGGVDNHEEEPKQYSLKGIMKEQGHKFIDILKIDIEGSEFEMLIEMIKSFEGQPLPFGQLEIEVHFGWSEMSTVGEFEEWWHVLETAGLRPFWTENNLLHANWFRGPPDVTEYSFINIRGDHALIKDVKTEYP